MTQPPEEPSPPLLPPTQQQPPPPQHPQQQVPWQPGPPPGPGGYAPYPGAYGAPSPYQQASSSNGKAIALIVGSIVFVILVFCGGIIGLFVWGVNSVEDSFDEFDSDRVGGSSNPITLEEGEEFEIDGIEYAAGWQVTPPGDEFSGSTITGLSGTNDREDGDSEYVYLTFEFLTADNVEVGEVRCSSNGSITHGNTDELECTSLDTIDGTHDRIEVSAF